MLITRAPKGTKDILPKESYKWQYIERIMRDVCMQFNFKEIRVPTFEHTELFLRSVGDTTDIVNKEMYTFTDKGNRSITLKPEGTAGVARAFVQNNLGAGTLPVKIYYINSPIFRYERPQAGRYREHHQFGIEMFGAEAAYADVEIILLAMTLLKKIGITSLNLHINSIGCPKCRPQYNEKLQNYFKDNLEKMCGTCKERFETNPLRMLDCKINSCQAIVKDAPKTFENLCNECEEHFDTLKKSLDQINVKYIVDPLIVRGLDYYTKTVFELITDTIGAQGTVCGGGRYDHLIEEVGGKPLPGIGFGMGMERLLLTMENAGTKIPEPKNIDIYLLSESDDSKAMSIMIANELRKKGFIVETDFVGRSLKAQMKYADKIDCRYVAIIDDESVSTNVVRLRNMEDGKQKEIKINEISKEIER